MVQELTLKSGPGMNCMIENVDRELTQRDTHKEKKMHIHICIYIYIYIYIVSVLR